MDTNFLVSATQWDYSVAHKLLKRFIEQDVKLFATKEILDEFSDVLQRDFKYSKDEVSNVIEKLLFIVELTEPTKKVDIIKEDPDDNKIIECAIASNSEFILTYDKHLLKHRMYEDIKIITPEQFMTITHSSSSSQAQLPKEAIQTT